MFCHYKFPYVKVCQITLSKRKKCIRPVKLFCLPHIFYLLSFCAPGLPFLLTLPLFLSVISFLLLATIFFLFSPILLIYMDAQIQTDSLTLGTFLLFLEMHASEAVCYSEYKITRSIVVKIVTGITVLRARWNDMQELRSLKDPYVLIQLSKDQFHNERLLDELNAQLSTPN